jgi:hypothetical protein
MIVTGHDPDAWPKFKKALQYYDRGRRQESGAGSALRANKVSFYTLSPVTARLDQVQGAARTRAGPVCCSRLLAPA